MSLFSITEDKTKYVSLIMIIWIGTALRLFRLESQSLWFDEASRLAQAWASVTAIWRNAGQDTQPPLYQLIQHFWLKLGYNDYLGRFLPAIAGICLVAVIFRLAYQLFDVKTALAAATLTAIMPYQIFHAQQANLYSLLVVISGLQMVSFWQAIHTNKWRSWAFYGVLLVLGFYTQYMSILTPLTLFLYFLLQKPSAKVWRRFIVVNVVSGLALLALLPRFLNGFQIITENFWLEKPSILEPLATLHRFLVSYSLPTWIAPIALFTTIGTVILSLYDLLKPDAEKGYRPGKMILYLFMLAFLPILLTLLISQIQPVYLDRALIITTPALIVLLARAFTLGKRSPVPYLGLVLIAVIIVALGNYYTNPDFAKPPYRTATKYVVDHFQPGDVIVHTSNGSYVPALFYSTIPDHYLLAGDPQPHQPGQVFEQKGGTTIDEDQLLQYKHIWLIVAFDHSLEYQQTVLKRFDQYYAILSQTDIGGILIRQYEVASP